MDNIESSYFWSEADFEKMDWHDCRIYGMAFVSSTFELQFDIDYILKWILPEESNLYKFDVVPSTLIFRNVYDLSTDICSLDIQIQCITRESPMPPKNIDYINEDLEYTWKIECCNGDEISFKSVGFKQFGRKLFQLSDHQNVDIQERGGVSFECPGKIFD